MKHIKLFEEVHYGDKHLGHPIKDYFPWYTYSRSLNNLPEINKLMNKTFNDSLPDDLINIASDWRKYGIYHNILVGKTIPSYGVQGDQLFINADENTAMVVVFEQHKTEYEVEDWDDVEKLRLMYTLGRKPLAEKYWNIKSEILELFEYLEYEIEDNNANQKEVYISNINNLIKNGDISYSDIKKISHKDVYDFIKNYNGSENFFYSLGSYLNRNGRLTERQIEACRKTLSNELISKKFGNKIAMVFKDAEPNRPTILRLKSKGYTVLETYDLIIVYK
jgi:hypothetical protein